MSRLVRLAVRAAVAGTVSCVASGLVACEATPVTAPAPPAPASQPRHRPPQPMLASIDWGQQVATSLGKDVPPSTTPANELVTQASNLLMGLRPGAEKEAQALLLQAWKGASDDQNRGTALALVAVSMVYDPTVEGYMERLTDAYGLAVYAGTIDTTSAQGQAARAIVMATGGAIRQARDLVVLLHNMPRFPEPVRPWLALARGATNDRSEDFFIDAELGLKARPDAWRLRALLADRLIELGATAEAIAAIEGGPDAKSAPDAARLTAARARVLGGQAADALAVLQGLTTSLTGVDEARRSEAIYWLAEAHLAQNDIAGAKGAAALLEARPGWQREAGLLAASLALLDGRVDDGKKLLLPLTSGTPASTVPVERRLTRLFIDICAEQRDAEGVERASRRLQTIDVDVDGLHNAALRAARPATDAARTGPEIWKGVAEPSSSTAILLGARRALASGLTSRGLLALDTLKDPALRAARALRVSAVTGDADKARAAVAALNGAGPPLAESDLLAVIDALGAAPTPQGKKLLEGLSTDPRPTVKKLADRSLADLQNPQLRTQRKTPPKVDRHGPGVDGPGHGPKLPPGMPTP